FKPYNGKHLGISGSPVAASTLHNQYGFTNIAVSFSDAVSMIGAGFKEDSIMIYLSYSQTQADFIGWVQPDGDKWKYYCVDEPNQNINNLSYEINMFVNYSQWIGMGSKLIFTSYYWPEGALCNSLQGADGWKSNIFLSYPNIYIMGDQYGHSCSWCGNVHEYWDEYKAYYGLNKYITNFISIASPSTNDWGDLLNLASAWGWGMDPIWVYAGGTKIYNDICAYHWEYPDENRVALFCSTAWQTHWLLRYSRYVTERWICLSPNPCTTCHWPDEGQWILDYAYTFDSRWVVY
ncbi:MAG: hypothetical protein WAM24_06305, partial [Ignavibacteriaceae bacterium]